MTLPSSRISSRTKNITRSLALLEVSYIRFELLFAITLGRHSNPAATVRVCDGNGLLRRSGSGFKMRESTAARMCAKIKRASKVTAKFCSDCGLS